MINPSALSLLSTRRHQTTTTTATYPKMHAHSFGRYYLNRSAARIRHFDWPYTHKLIPHWYTASEWPPNGINNCAESLVNHSLAIRQLMSLIARMQSAHLIYFNFSATYIILCAYNANHTHARDVLNSMDNTSWRVVDYIARSIVFGIYVNESIHSVMSSMRLRQKDMCDMHTYISYLSLFVTLNIQSHWRSDFPQIFRACVVIVLSPTHIHPVGMLNAQRQTANSDRHSRWHTLHTRI